MLAITQHRWSVLTGVLGLQYLYIGVMAEGPLRLAGLLGGGLIVLAAVAAAVATAAARVALPPQLIIALAAAGSLPLAVLAWWSLVVPVIAVLSVVFTALATRPGRLHKELS